MQSEDALSSYRSDAKKNIDLWRLVFEGGMSKKEVDNMTTDEYHEATAGLNEYNRMVNKSSNQKQPKG